MGKWSDIAKNLPRMPLLAEEGGDKYQDKVNAVKSTIDIRSPSELAALYTEVRVARDKQKELLSTLNLNLKAVEQLLIDAYETEDITTIKLEGVGSVRTESAPHAVVEDKEKCRLWSIANNMVNEMVLPWGTINSLVKDRLLSGDAEPDGVKAYLYTKIVFTSEK